MKVIGLITGILIILFLSYLSIPNIYNQNDVETKLKSEYLKICH